MAAGQDSAARWGTQRARRAPAAIALLVAFGCVESAAPQNRTSVPPFYCGEHAIFYDSTEMATWDREALDEALQEMERTRAMIIGLMR